MQQIGRFFSFVHRCRNPTALSASIDSWYTAVSNLMCAMTDHAAHALLLNTITIFFICSTAMDHITCHEKRPHRITHPEHIHAS